MVPWELGSVFKDSHFCTSKCRLPFALVLICAFILPACNAGGKNELLLESENGALIYAALNPVTRELQARVDTFNANHEDARIEIRDYSDEGGIERFRLELMAGGARILWSCTDMLGLRMSMGLGMLRVSVFPWMQIWEAPEIITRSI